MSKRPTVTLSSEKALGIGPLNTANQATGWARAVRGCSAVSIGNGGMLARAAKRSPLTSPTDVSVPHYRLSPTWFRKAQVARVRQGLTHFLDESNIPLGVDPKTMSFLQQRASWDEAEVQVAIVFHGSDIRDPTLSMLDFPHSYFHSAPEDWVRMIGNRVSRNRMEIADTDVPLFVTTPDLLTQVKGAKLLPLTIDTARWAASPLRFEGKLRVLHQPSRRTPDIKGSRFVEPVLSELADQGLIEYLHEGLVPPARMRELILTADVVVDQLLSGAYGVTSVEAMAAGRIVVSGVGPATERAFSGAVPIIDADPDSFRDVMHQLIATPVEDLMERGTRSREFAALWHDGRAAAVVLEDFLS